MERMLGPDRPVEVEVDDYDGVLVLFDVASVRNRFGTHGDQLGDKIHAELRRLMDAREVAALGTHDGGTFAVHLVLGALPEDPGGTGSTVEAGVVRTEGTIQLAGWHAFAPGCRGAGVVSAPGAPTVDLPPATYRVTARRPMGTQPDPLDQDLFADLDDDEEPLAPVAHPVLVVSLVQVDDLAIPPPGRRVPGSDRWF